MKRFLAIATAALTAAATPALAQGGGFQFVVEGGAIGVLSPRALGLDSAQFSQAEDSVPYDILLPVGLYGRAGFLVEMSEQPVRFGLTFNGWWTGRSVSDAFASTRMSIGDGTSAASASLGCLDAETQANCVYFDYSGARAYRELVPEIAVRVGDGSILLSLQPFWGRASERTDSFAYFDEAYFASNHRQTTLVGEVFGALGGVETERALGPGTLTLGAALGLYRFTADATARIVTADGPLGQPIYLSAEFGGVRAQAFAGYSVALSPRMTIGAIARADFWSAYPTLAPVQEGDDFEPNSIASRPLFSLSLGVRLTYSFGG